jgi:hypothetical protein
MRRLSETVLVSAGESDGYRQHMPRGRSVPKTHRFCRKAGIIGRDRSGGERTERLLPHRGVRAHGATMGQDSGVGAGAAVTGRGDVFDQWARRRDGPSARRRLKESPAPRSPRYGGGQGLLGQHSRGWGAHGHRRGSSRYQRISSSGDHS